MKIGITGTREGMNEIQRVQLRELLDKINFQCSVHDVKPEFHHGDCKGVDVEAAQIARDLGYTIVCHPPISNEQQGHFGGDENRQPKGYLERDRNIVDETDFLLVVPLQNEWQPKGGTWYTHDYAVKKGKPLMIFYPGVKHD